jgi:polyvinyl alcohol dehydrogenase (cytochrome)
VSPIHAIVLAALSLAATSAAAAPAPADGGKVYAERCAGCHDKGVGHTPDREALGRRPSINITMALRGGIMKAQAQGLSTDQIQAVADYLTAEAAARREPLRANLCPTSPGPLRLDSPSWNGWGRDLANTRAQPQPGLGLDEIDRLKVKWAFAYPGAMTWGQPTVVGNRVFVASSTGQVYSLDAASGCTLWTIEPGAPVRTAVVVGPGPEGAIAYFGDTAAVVHAVDAQTGRELWKRKMDEHPLARITGSPVLGAGRLIVPVSSFEEGAASSAAYPCCSFRGSVAALDPVSGKLLWQSYTLSKTPHPYHRKGLDTQLQGPAGAAVWNAPTVDERRRLVYVGVGNNYTDIDAPTTDAVMAMDLITGKIRWTRQLGLKDHWAAGCAYGGPCPQPAGPDYDIAVSVILVTLPSGRQVLAAGQKSGAVFGLDPDRKGKVLWRAKFGTGGIFGGIEWGMAALGPVVYAPISDSMTDQPGQPGLGAIDASTGRQIWWAPAKAVCSWGESSCRASRSQAVSAIPGLVFSGSQDGRLIGHSAIDGKEIWSFDTAREVTPVNAAKAAGGSLDAGGPVIVDGVVYVNSGYGQFFGRGGNVLLALSIDGK